MFNKIVFMSIFWLNTGSGMLVEPVRVSSPGNRVIYLSKSAKSTSYFIKISTIKMHNWYKTILTIKPPFNLDISHEKNHHTFFPDIYYNYKCANYFPENFWRNQCRLG